MVTRILRHSCGELIEEHRSPDIGGTTIIDYSPIGAGRRHFDLDSQCPYCGRPLTEASLEVVEVKDRAA